MSRLTKIRAGIAALTVAALGATGLSASAAVTPLADIKPVFTVFNPPSGVVDTPYTFTFEATGTPTPTISLTGTLPPGLSFAGGTVSGTPTTAGSYPVTVKATNTAGEASKSATILIGSQARPPAIPGGVLPSVVVGSAYRVYLVSTGFPTPVISLASGTLPPGIELTANQLVGTPTKDGTYNFELRASNASGIDTADYTLTVIPIVTPPVITAATPGPGQVRQPYFYSFKAEGYPAPRFSLASGTLPPGLTLSQGGTLSGRPTTTGTYTFKVKAYNSAGSDESDTLSVRISNPVCQAQGQFAVGFAKGSTKLSDATKKMIKQTVPKNCVANLRVTAFARAKESAKTAAELSGARARAVSRFIATVNPELTVEVLAGGSAKKAICEDLGYRCAVIRFQPVV